MSQDNQAGVDSQFDEFEHGVEYRIETDQGDVVFPVPYRGGGNFEGSKFDYSLEERDGELHLEKAHRSNLQFDPHLGTVTDISVCEDDE